MHDLQSEYSFHMLCSAPPIEDEEGDGDDKSDADYNASKSDSKSDSSMDG